MAIKPVTFQGAVYYKANLYALEIRSRFADQANANGYYEKYGDELAVIADSNVIKIASGVLVVQGRAFEITADGESVNVTIESGKVGYVIARIETYKTNGQNCSIVVKTATTLAEIPLIQQDTYTATSDTDENKIYELPLYSFNMPSATVITSFVKLISPINEVGKIADVARQANEKSNSALANSGGGYTFIVDSDKKLEQWANNADGNDYSKVLIKKGLWTYHCPSWKEYGVNLTETKTLTVIGESGSCIEFYSTSDEDFTGLGYDDLQTAKNNNCLMQGVNCCVYDMSERYARTVFYNCVNLSNCIANGVGYYVKGFRNCVNLSNCIADVTGGGGNIGFYSCEILTACQGSARTNTSHGYGYGFSNCSGCSRCSRFNNSSNSTFETINCCANLGNYNSSYAVANTPLGGFNDLT